MFNPTVCQNTYVGFCQASPRWDSLQRSQTSILIMENEMKKWEGSEEWKKRGKWQKIEGNSFLALKVEILATLRTA